MGASHCLRLINLSYSLKKKENKNEQRKLGTQTKEFKKREMPLFFLGHQLYETPPICIYVWMPKIIHLFLSFCFPFWGL